MYSVTILVTIDGVWICDRIYWTLTSKDYAVTVLHISQVTISHTRSSQPVTVFTSRCFVVASNGRYSPSSGFPNGHRPQLPASNSNSSQLNPSGYLTHSPANWLTDWVLVWVLCYDRRSVGQVCLGIKHPFGASTKFLWLSDSCGFVDVDADERTGLSFAIAAGPRQHSHSQVRVPWDLRPYFTVSDSRLPFSSPPTTRRATVEVFDPVSTREEP
jgi:hypothetical protein